MSENEKDTTTITWRPDYQAERLYKTDWYEKNGWDFLGCIVDIQLRRENGDFFFVKYVGSIEGIDLDTGNDGDEEIRVVYHFGVEKMTGKRWLFRPDNIFVIRHHHSSKGEIESIEQGKTVFPFANDSPITKDLIDKLDKEDDQYDAINYSSCCF